MRRDTLIDFFADLSHARGEFLVYDDGYRTHTYTYEDTVRAARAFAARLAQAGLTQGRRRARLEREPARMDRRALGLPAPGRRGRAHRLSRVPGLSAPRRRYRQSARAADRQRSANQRDVRDGGTARVGARRAATGVTTSRVPDAVVTRDDVAEIIFTSGATAEPKGVVITPSQHPRQHRPDRARDGEVPEVRAAVLARFASSTCCRSATCSARRWRRSCRRCCAARSSSRAATTRTTSSGRSDSGASRCWCACRRSSTCCAITSLARRAGGRGPPPRDDALGAAVVAVPPRPPHVRLQVLGDRRRRGAARSRELEAFWGRLGFVVVQGYGLTETAPIVTLNHPLARSRGAVGKPIAGVEVQDRGRRRDPRPRRQRHDRVLQRAGGDARRRSRTAGSTPATSASSTRRAGCSSAAARRK